VLKWVLKLILRNLGSNSWVYREGRRRVWVLETTYQNRVSSPLPSAIEEAEFVRGYFDAEGGVPRRLNDRFYIQLVQKNRLDLNRVRDSIRRQGIHAVDCTIPARQLIRTTGVSMSE
jgi:intein-encoded DNA endonuclease-like protein